MSEPEVRPITVDELKPFFGEAGQVHLELALTRYHLAVAKAQLAQEADEAAA